MYKRFEELCKERNVTPYKVSKATGISRSTLSDWKTGKSTPKADKLQMIADYFDVPIETFTGDKSKKKIVAVFRKGITASDLFASSPVPADGQPEWYTNPETARLAQAAFDRPDLGVLMDASADLPPESVLALVEIAKRMKGTND